MPRVEVNDGSVHQTIKSQKNKKASRPEGILSELLKNRTNKLIFILAKLFQRYINGDQITKTWKEAWILPILKKWYKR